MAAYMYHVQIIGLSGATLAGFNVHGDGTIVDALLAHQPQSELCTNDRYVFMFGCNKCTLHTGFFTCLLYTSPSPRDKRQSRMPSSA